MKVIYEYDDKTMELLSKVDKAINLYIVGFEKELINVPYRLMSEIIHNFKDDPEYRGLIQLKMEILSHAIPKVIIIKSADSTEKVILDEK
jgi:hypothetical protein